MNRLYKLLFFLFVSSSIVFTADKKIVSKVVAVTVYNDRALVTRTFSERLVVGTHMLVIPNLPATLLDNSMRVGGTSEARVRVVDVQVQSVFLDTIPEERIQTLTTQLQRLRDDKVDNENRQAVLRARLMTLDSLVNSYSRVFGNGPAGRSPLEDWERLLQFESRLRTEHTTQITSLMRESRTLDTRIRSLEQTLLSQTGAVRKSVKQVKIAVDVRSEGEVSGEVSYIVADASWSPSYELRFRSGDTVATMTFMGEVRQSTGEDWNNIRMTLSTAQPSRGAEIPPAIPWLVENPRQTTSSAMQRRDVQPNTGMYIIDQSGRPNEIRGRAYDRQSGEPLIGANILVVGTNAGAATDANGYYSIVGVTSGTYQIRATYVGYASVVYSNIQATPQGTSLLDFGLSSSTVQSSDVVIMGSRPLIQRNTTNTIRVDRPNEIDLGEVAAGGFTAEYGPKLIGVGLGEVQRDISSTSFLIGVPSNIPGDKVGHKVSIAINDFPTSYEFVAVPKASPYVYLTAKMINNAPYPLIGGPATIFTDGSFVASTSLPATLPRDTVTLNIGVDEAFKSSRKVVRTFSEEVGTFSKSIRVTYEVHLTVQSSRPRLTTVEVREALPYSADERITIKYLDPPDLKKMIGSSGLLTWKPTISTDSTAILKMRYSIEYPKDTFNPVYR